MAKKKQKKQPRASLNKPKQIQNPFESRSQKPRYPVLNSKLRGNVVKPTQSRTRSTKKREQTLGVELSRKTVNNTFLDKRFLGVFENLAPEDRNLMLFQRQRANEWKNKNEVFYEDNVTLTHGGQAIDVDALEAQDEESEDSLETEMSFGGLKRKLRKELADNKELLRDDAREGQRTKDLVMKDVVAKSKYYKYQRFQEKEQQHLLTQKLDHQFSEVVSLLENKKVKRTEKSEESAKGSEKNGRMDENTG